MEFYMIIAKKRKNLINKMERSDQKRICLFKNGTYQKEKNIVEKEQAFTKRRIGLRRKRLILKYV